jgi:hypothetical protein
MMGRQTSDQSQLFYLSNLERRIPRDEPNEEVNGDWSLTPMLVPDRAPSRRRTLSGI